MHQKRGLEGIPLIIKVRNTRQKNGRAGKNKMGKDKDSIKELMEKSGNNFHFDVVRFLRKEGWEVLISPYYTDNITDKPREIDIIAEKEFVIKEYPPIRDKPIGNLNVKLFVECKHVNSETVFWFDKKDEGKARKRVEKDISPLRLPESEDTAIYKHHYLNKEEVAKLSASSRNKSQEYEIIYKALTQSLNAMIYYKNSGSIISKENSNGLKSFKTINYPLILCNSFDNFYKVIDLGEKKSYPKITDASFQLEVNYVYYDKSLKKDCDEYFLVDIIDFTKLSDFLNGLEEVEVKAISEMERVLPVHRRV